MPSRDGSRRAPLRDRWHLVEPPGEVALQAGESQTKIFTRRYFVVAKTMGEPCKSFYYRTQYFENLYRHAPNDVQLG
jgi:hypothetical protein